MAGRIGRGTRLFSLLIAAGVVGLVGLTYWWSPDFFHRVETNLYDQHFKLRGPSPSTRRA